MAKWKPPPEVKVYEALGAIVDGHVNIVKNDGGKGEAQVESSMRDYVYSVSFDLNKNAITADDNGSKWQGYLGYPSIAVLMALGKLPYRRELALGLKGIKWAVLNKKFRRDYAQTIAEAQKVAEERGINLEELKVFVSCVMDEIKKFAFDKC